MEAGLSARVGRLADFLRSIPGLRLFPHGGFLFIDNANLVVHEGGHNLFAWFGPTLCLWGGTLLQWLVPFLLAAYFFTQRQTTGFVFCQFFFFENWLYTATYMADARSQVLPHDWRFGLCGTRLLRHLFESRRAELRHEDRGGGALVGLVRNDRLCRMAGFQS